MMAGVSRAPSVAWEPVAVPGIPVNAVWVWFFPASAPTTVIFNVPAVPGVPRPSLRILLHATGMDPRSVRSWVVSGAAFDAMFGANPWLDQPLPVPMTADTTVVVHLAAAVPTASAPAAPGPVTDSASSALYSAIEADWNAIQQVEAQLAGLRKQLSGLAGRLNSLNRDLSIDEKRAGDSQDLREWQDIRRWLRESAAVVSRVLRAFDVGITSGAGNRNKFDDIFDQYVKPRRPLENLGAVQHQFESHRKTVLSLQNDMQSALTNASRDGEQRAGQFLSRISAKVRNSRTKR
jgi:hypothetical protein